MTISPLLGGALVARIWSTGAGGTCATAVDVTCTAVLSGIGKRTTSVTFTVGAITLAGCLVDPSGPSTVLAPRPQ